MGILSKKRKEVMTKLYDQLYNYGNRTGTEKTANINDIIKSVQDSSSGTDTTGKIKDKLSDWMLPLAIFFGGGSSAMLRDTRADLADKGIGKERPEDYRQNTRKDYNKMKEFNTEAASQVENEALIQDYYDTMDMQKTEKRSRLNAFSDIVRANTRNTGKMSDEDLYLDDLTSADILQSILGRKTLG